MSSQQWLMLIGIAVTLLFTWLLLIDAVARGRFSGKLNQLDAAYRRFSGSATLPSRYRRLRLKLVILAVLVILTVICLGFLLSWAPGERAVHPASTQSATTSRLSASAPPPSRTAPRGRSTGGSSIQLEQSPDSAGPFQPVRIQGRYHGGAGIFLRVQRWEGGQWLDFPIPTKTNQAGKFSTYVELGQPGRHRLRVRDPNSGLTSEPFGLVISG